MRCTALLSDEHKAILRALNLLRAVAPGATRGNPEAVENAIKLVDFFREFVDHFHFLKEETLLFPRLRKLMPAGSGSVTKLRLENDQSRALLHNMGNALGGNRAHFGLYAERFGQLLAGHVGKEDKTLFPRAESILSEEDDDELANAFETLQARMGEDVTRRFYQMLESLEEECVPGLEVAG